MGTLNTGSQMILYIKSQICRAVSVQHSGLEWSKTDSQRSYPRPDLCLTQDRLSQRLTRILLPMRNDRNHVQTGGP